MKREKKSLSEHLWNLWCIVSLIGLWPRFIEPRMISTTLQNVFLSNLPNDLKDLKILQFSDLHLHSGVSDRFIAKLCRKVTALKPDIIVFTGDMLCFSSLKEEIRLKKILNKFSAPYGCYAILGNHDYQRNVSINEQGDYDIVETSSSSICKGFKRFFNPLKLTKITTPRAKNVDLHKDFIKMLSQTPFVLLHNQTKVLQIKNTFLNITGLGEYMLAKCLPEQAFRQYEPKAPGIVLAHNPDSLSILKNYPGDVILCGHTHGAQINLPWMWKFFTLLEDQRFIRGSHRFADKWVYVNRGIGSTMPFRWFSTPELLLIKLRNHEK